MGRVAEGWTRPHRSETDEHLWDDVESQEITDGPPEPPKKGSPDRGAVAGERDWLLPPHLRPGLLAPGQLRPFFSTGLVLTGVRGVCFRLCP